MRTVARTGTTLLALSAAVLFLGACGENDEPAASGAPGVVAEGGSGDGAAGTVEEGTTGPGDAAACGLYAADGETFRLAYDEYGSGSTDDPSTLVDSLDALAADIDAVPADEVSSPVLATATEISAAAAAAVPALEGGGGVEEIDATLAGLETLADTCAELGIA
ncbi:hypothetical protein [Trujillonella endophytica]|uniref:Uncharacterized protein n=1 Tax=Trujillonella endophytica TaxID=673521 RepID=A0A1H8W1S1_9ACTN|nr:hypothetical protein [Trujillella endophytica]SEP21550.1 hypothetical protein SAMN05660991_03979 [Trujillella endophytica]